MRRNICFIFFNYFFYFGIGNDPTIIRRSYWSHWSHWTPTQVLPSGIYNILKNTYFEEHLKMTASLLLYSHIVQCRIKKNKNCCHGLPEERYYKNLNNFRSFLGILGWICLRSMKPMQRGKIQISLKPAEILNHNSFDEYTFMKGYFIESTFPYYVLHISIFRIVLLKLFCYFNICWNLKIYMWTFQKQPLGIFLFRSTETIRNISRGICMTKWHSWYQFVIDIFLRISWRFPKGFLQNLPGGLLLRLKSFL